MPPITHLLEPFTFESGLVAKNRIVLAPLTRGRSGPSRIPNDLLKQYYEQRANAGIVITEGTTISEVANGWTDNAGIYTQAMADGWKPVVEAVHAQGALICCQLWHLGRASHSSFQVGNQPPVAPSAIAIVGEGVYAADGTKQPHEVPRALETSELAGVVAEYVNAARLAKDAGFDLIEIHCANGYLLDEFLQSSSNHRTDAYGGSVENRFRLIKEILEAVSQVFPINQIGARISPNGAYNGMGSADNIETFTYVASQFNALGLGYLHVMDGLGFGYHNKCRPMNLMELKRVFYGPVIGNVGYTRDTAEGAVRTGAADFISFGRPYISNPDLVQRFINDWPLAPDNYAVWFTHDAVGYADFPNYTPPESAST